MARAKAEAEYTSDLEEEKKRKIFTNKKYMLLLRQKLIAKMWRKILMELMPSLQGKLKQF